MKNKLFWWKFTAILLVIGFIICFAEFILNIILSLFIENNKAIFQWLAGEAIFALPLWWIIVNKIEPNNYID